MMNADLKESTVRNIAIIILLIIASFFVELKLLLYGCSGAIIIGLIYRYTYLAYINFFQNKK